MSFTLHHPGVGSLRFNGDAFSEEELAAHLQVCLVGLLSGGLIRIEDVRDPETGQPLWEATINPNRADIVVERYEP